MDEDKYTDKQVCDILSNNHFSNLLQYVLHMFGTMPRSMTEEEIVQYLKMNKNIGIVFKFMPEEVKNWSSKHSEKLCWYDVDCWINGRTEKRLYDDKIYALSEDFKMEEKLQGEWVEFGIKKNGRFTAFDVDDNDHQISFSFGWHQWSEFIDCSYEHALGYTAFGGWQYADSNTWFMTPKLRIIQDNSISYKDSDAVGNYPTTPSALECKPAIPVKIRFWKGE